MDARVGQPYEFTDEEIIRIVDVLALFDEETMFSEEEQREFRKLQEQFIENED